MSQVWRNCSVCKTAIQQGSIYQKCSVSTCHKAAYCSVECWDSHVPIMNHKSAWAEEETAPREVYNADKPRRRIVPSQTSRKTSTESELPQEILVVVSKLKNFVKSAADMNTSGDVADELSRIIRVHTLKAIENAKRAERKTLMARDFELD